MGIGAWVDVEKLGQNTLNLHVENVPLLGKVKFRSLFVF